MKRGHTVSHASSRSVSLSPVPGKEQAVRPVSVFLGAFRALPFTLIIGFVLLLVAAAAAYAQADPDRFQTPLAICAAALTSLTGGFLTSRFNRGAALLSGLAGGILFVGLLMILSLCFFNGEGSGYSSTVSFLLHAGVVLLEIIGAFLGLPRESSPGRKRRKPPMR